MSSIAHNLQAVHERIAAVARNMSRDPDGIVLLPVSKTFGPDAAVEAAKAGAWSGQETQFLERENE